MLPAYRIITPDGETFEFDSTRWIVDDGIPDGFDLPPVEHDTQDLYMLPGAVLKSIKINPRIITITAKVNACSLEELHEFRSQLFQVLRWNRTLVSPPEPLTFQYESGGNRVNLYAHYLSEVVERMNGSNRMQSIGVRLVAYDPLWYSPDATSYALLVNLSLNVNYVLGKENNLWSSMNDGGNGAVRGFAADDDYVYAIGSFTTMGGVAATHIARWTGSVWQSLGAAYGSIHAITLNSENYPYIIYSNDFAAPWGVAYYDGAWNGIGTPNGVASTIAHSPYDGYMYVGGGFTSISGVNATRIAYWDGSAWNPFDATLVGPDNGLVTCLAFHPSGRTYVGGTFTTINGLAVPYLTYFKDSLWSTGIGSLNGAVMAMAIAPNGDLYVGGAFTTIDGAAISYIAKWNGSSWSALGSGVNGTVTSLYFDDNGLLYVGGTFTQAGRLSLADHIATWNGTSWAQTGGEIPGSPTFVVAYTHGDNQYFGFDTSGSVSIPGKTETPINNGDHEAWPVFTITGPGMLSSIENTVTGKFIWFNLEVFAGEVVTIDLRPGHKSITSNGRGNLMPYVPMLPTSDFATFSIVPDPIAPGGVNPLNIGYFTMPPDARASVYVAFNDAYLAVDKAVL